MGRERALRYSRPAVRVFEAMFRPWLRSRLELNLRLPRAAWLDDRPLLFAANHVSWYDGFLLRELHRQLRPAAPLYTLMGTTELAARPFLRLLGVYPIDPSTRSVLRAFRMLAARRALEPELCISYFPQGMIWPSTRRPLQFRGGVERLAQLLAPCAVVPVALHIEPLNRVRPTAFVWAGTPIPGEAASLRAIEIAVARTLTQLHTHIHAHGEGAVPC